MTAYLDADYHDPETVISDAFTVLNFTRPIAVMFMGVLGHAHDLDTAYSIVAQVMDAVPAGSYLVHWEATDDDPDFVRLCQDYASTGAVPYLPQPVEEIRRRFEGFQMVDPGLVSITQWRPDPTEVGRVAALDEAIGGVAHRP